MSLSLQQKQLAEIKKQVSDLCTQITGVRAELLNFMGNVQNKSNKKLNFSKGPFKSTNEESSFKKRLMSPKEFFSKIFETWAKNEGEFPIRIQLSDCCNKIRT